MLSFCRYSRRLGSVSSALMSTSRLQHSPNPNLLFGFFVLGKPLSCICQGAAIFTLAMGAFRTWRMQNAIVRGKAISGGFEIVSLSIGMFLVSNPSQCLQTSSLLLTVSRGLTATVCPRDCSRHRQGRCFFPFNPLGK